MAPSPRFGATVVHLHGGHTEASSDGWPDNVQPPRTVQRTWYSNDYDNTPAGAPDKIGALLWYHDHAMDVTRHHVYSGLAGAYVVRDLREAELGLPTSVEEGEWILLLADRNVDGTPGPGATGRWVHKTTTADDPDNKTPECFGPLTTVNGRIWPRLHLRPGVYRLRLLNASNARTFRLHWLGSGGASAADRVRVIGTDGGLLQRAYQPTDPIVLMSAERVDLLLDLSDAKEGDEITLVNSAFAPFDPAPVSGDPATPHPDQRLPHPEVMQIRVAAKSPHGGSARTAALAEVLDGRLLDDRWKRIVHVAHGVTPPVGTVAMSNHEHRLFVLAEDKDMGMVTIRELVSNEHGTVVLALPGTDKPASYSVGATGFYDTINVRPSLGRWEVWRFINVTEDSHPIHIHQVSFQPLNEVASLVENPKDYDAKKDATKNPLQVDPGGGRTYAPHETTGWKDTIRVDSGQMVSVAVRFDLVGRYMVHCHILEHEDSMMMRPFVVTLEPQKEMGGGPPMPGMS